jgi:histidinol dehydrogenase
VQAVYKVGGAQAISALAFGTESIPKVDKIFGPGNAYVTEAKRQVSQRLDGAAIDMPAGPSEVLVIADSGATPDFVASDLLSQAEHGPDSQVILLTPDADMAKRVGEAVERQLADLPRADTARQALAASRLIVARDLSSALPSPTSTVRST